MDIDQYQELAATTAIYPRVYTEGQVREMLEWAVAYDGTVVDDLQEALDEILNSAETPFNRLVYPILGLLGEAGEIANKAKKIARDHDGEMDLTAVESIEGELGDIEWYGAAIATELNIKLSTVLGANLGKLFSRKERGVLGGSGDTR